MASRQDRSVRRQISTLFNIGVITDLTDGQLLERFSTGQGEAAELAFAALVERHGPMVLRVCRARLADPEEALDAFQATFLVLSRSRAGSGFATRWAPGCTRSPSALHRAPCRPPPGGGSSGWRPRSRQRSKSPMTLPGQELEDALHEEINRLPDRYRIAIVLCDLEGQTCEQAARRIGRPVGTVKCWRARGRERLRQRLIRAGLAPSLAPGAALVVSDARHRNAGPQVAEATGAL